MPIQRDRDGNLHWIRDWAQEAKELGLPEGAGRLEVGEENRRRYWAEELQLPKDAQWAAIINQKVILARIEMAKERGLPEDSTWTDIQRYDDSCKEEREN